MTWLIAAVDPEVIGAAIAEMITAVIAGSMMLQESHSAVQPEECCGNGEAVMVI
jgi:hypothetical protein